MTALTFFIIRVFLAVISAFFFAFATSGSSVVLAIFGVFLTPLLATTGAFFIVRVFSAVLLTFFVAGATEVETWTGTGWSAERF